MTVEVFAPAKINLTLHVTGQRPDGFHILDSLVTFIDVGDRVTVEKASSLSFSLKGEFAGDLPDGAGNLVLDAAQLFSDQRGARVFLEKNLPVASGIGGGSADAAATLRALAELWDAEIPDQQAVLGLGADVPVCLNGATVRMQGIGERQTPVELPILHMVLVNPGVAVPTPAVFAGLKSRENRPMDAIPDVDGDAIKLTRWLGQQRNDLQAPACQNAPQIDDVLAKIGQQIGCLLARMSGSGATCFGIFETRQAARDAADSISKSKPTWWVRATQTLK